MSTEEVYNIVKAKELSQLPKNQFHNKHYFIGDSPIENFFGLSEGIFLFWKDLKSVYLGGNDYEQMLAGLYGDNTVVGKSDCDLSWHEQADKLQENDRNVMLDNESKIFFEDIQVVHGEIIKVLSCKMPMYDSSNKLVGTFGMGFCIDNINYNNVESIVRQVDIKLSKDILLHSLNETKVKRKLTERESQCMYYLVRGMTAKEIGRKMFLSPKTVEYYINSVKTKFHCRTRSELICKILDENILPIKY